MQGKPEIGGLIVVFANHHGFEETELKRVNMTCSSLKY